MIVRRWDEDKALLEAALLSLPLTREPTDAASEVAAASALGQSLAQAAETDHRSSLSDDVALLLSATTAAVEGSVDPRLPPIIEYRIQWKRLWEVL